VEAKIHLGVVGKFEMKTPSVEGEEFKPKDSREATCGLDSE
jgi:hypothetical protein